MRPRSPALCHSKPACPIPPQSFSFLDSYQRACDAGRVRILTTLLGMCAANALASQFVVAEATYTHSSNTTSDSHYRLTPLTGTPTNWVSPVDYSRGTAVVRLEVFTKPTDARTRFQICFEATPNYACTDQAPAYSTTGVYTWTTLFSNFYQYSLVDWSKGTLKVALILKDTQNVKPAPENVGGSESARYLPTDLRVTVTIVSSGGVYVPPNAALDAGVDGGQQDAGVDAGSIAHDAGSALDSGSGLDAGDFSEHDAGRFDAGVTSVDPVPKVSQAARGGCESIGFSLACGVFAVFLLRRRSRQAGESGFASAGKAKPEPMVGPVVF
jgi:hypothetical protein